MLVYRKRKKLILSGKHKARVQSVIPHAKSFEYKGKLYVAVPHGLDETRILRNLDLAAPNPVDFYYDWPMSDRSKKPFDAQKVTTSMLIEHSRMFVLNQVGTGKTLSVLWAFDYLKSEGLANKLIVVAPLSALENAWGDEIFRNFPHLTYSVLHGSKQKRLKLLEQDVDIYIINNEGVGIIRDALIARKDIDTVVVDEGHYFRNAGTDMWKAMKRVTEGRPRVWWLTGTPIPNQPTDAWAQVRLVRPDNVPPYFGKFRDMVMRQTTQWTWQPRDNALETVYNVMQPGVRFKRSDCLDLPPTIYETKHVELTPEQARAYQAMKAKLHAEIGSGQVTAANEAVKMGKLLQIGLGVCYDNTGEEAVLPNHTRIKAILEIIEEAAAKVIVFVPYTSALTNIAEELAKHYSVEVVHGETKKSDRVRIFREFQRSKDPHVLVANAGTMSTSLTLTAASTIIWAGPSVSNATYEQSNGRITRPSQQNTQMIFHLESTPVERAIYNRLRNKGKTQGLLLEMFKEGKF